jgi:putative colanic acid biosynthesis glycosyltransferase WcaI
MSNHGEAAPIKGSFDKQRWLIVTQYFPPESGAPQVRLWALIKELKKFGIEISVLTAMPNYPEGVVHAEYRGKFFCDETMEGMKIHRTWVYGYTGRNKLLRLLNYVSFAFSAAPKFLALKKPDLVFVESQPLPVGIIGLLARYIKRVPYIYNVPDLQVEVTKEMGWVDSNLFLSASRALENLFLNKSWKVSTVTFGFMDFFAKQRNVDPKKITFLPNGVDTSLLKPLPPDRELLDRLGLKNEKVFVYAGTHAHYHRLETVIEAAELIKGRQDIKIVMVGRGPVRSRLKQMARDKGLDNVIFARVPFEQTSQLMSIACAALVILRKTQVSKLMRLAKTMPPMACATPVILSVEGESADLIREHHSGLVCEPEDPDSLAQAMLKLAGDEKLARQMGQNGLRFVQTELEWQVIVANWLGSLHALSGGLYGS